MLFNSYIFVFLFLPAAVAGYFILNRFHRDIWAKCYLFAMSLWFYGYFNYRYLPVILSSLLVNYVVARLLEQDAYGQCGGRRKVLFGLGLVFNIGLLFYFKYFNFFLENINSV